MSKIREEFQGEIEKRRATFAAKVKTNLTNNFDENELEKLISLIDKVDQATKNNNRISLGVREVKLFAKLFSKI